MLTSNAVQSLAHSFVRKLAKRCGGLNSHLEHADILLLMTLRCNHEIQSVVSPIISGLVERRPSCARRAPSTSEVH